MPTLNTNHAGGRVRRRLLSALVFLLLATWAWAQGALSELARPVQGRSMRATSSFRQGSDGKYDAHANPLGDEQEKSNFDNRLVPPGDQVVLLDAQGPGLVTHMWFTFLEPQPRRDNKPGRANHQEFLLRMYWDGSERPGVEAPFGDFFASCFGKRREVNSVPVAVEGGDSYNCYWHMPFRKSARIEIANDSDRPLVLLYYNIDWIKKDNLPEDTPYFYAQYRQEYPQTSSQDYVILDTRGKGHYVGTVLAIRTRSPLWFGEGDEKIYIDGETKPSIWGTGTEDFFCCAMGLANCSLPYFGVPYFNQFEIVGSMTAAYRWHVGDPLVFNTGIKVTLEHKSWISEDENPDHKRMSWNEREDDYASVAFWYQTGTPTFAARAPNANERRLPSLDRVVALARNFTDARYHGNGHAGPQPIPDLFDEPQLFYRPEKADGAFVEVPFEVKRKEPLRLLINVTCAPDYGRYQASLEGVKLGGVMDFHAETLIDREFHLLDFWPEPGTYTLRLECVGKSNRSEGYCLGLESVRLRERRPRVEQYGFDKDKDWRKRPILYTKE
ncbi:MAG: DUF2961 domain-containing protein [Phycisphaerae bacterium]|nr:DUF2961 domain-containing protein [Phycisphaerae bacterium]